DTAKSARSAAPSAQIPAAIRSDTGASKHASGQPAHMSPKLQDARGDAHNTAVRLATPVQPARRTAEVVTPVSTPTPISTMSSAQRSDTLATVLTALTQVLSLLAHPAADPASAAAAQAAEPVCAPAEERQDEETASQSVVIHDDSAQRPALLGALASHQPSAALLADDDFEDEGDFYPERADNDECDELEEDDGEFEEESDEEEEDGHQGKSVAVSPPADDRAFAAAVVKQEASREEGSYDGPAAQCHGPRAPLREPHAARSAPKGNYGADFAPADALQLVAGATRPADAGVARLGAVLADGSARVQAGKLPPSRRPPRFCGPTQLHAAPPTPGTCTAPPANNTQPATRGHPRYCNNTTLTTAQHTPLTTPVASTTFHVPEDETQPPPFTSARPSRRTAPCTYNISTGPAPGTAHALAISNHQPGPQNVTRDELLQVVQALTDSKSTTPVHYTPPIHISRYTTSKPMEMKAWLQQLKAWFRACHLGREFWAEQVVAWMDARMAKEIADVPVDDFELFEKVLLERYASPDASVSAFEDLQATRQKANESCRAFMWKVQRLVRKAYPDVSAEQI
ncbi:MAG: hypothetical protein FD187_3228, partial [bacterium]